VTGPVYLLALGVVVVSILLTMMSYCLGRYSDAMRPFRKQWRRWLVIFLIYFIPISVLETVIFVVVR
jgi:uncharacterized membrane protein